MDKDLLPDATREKMRQRDERAALSRDSLAALLDTAAGIYFIREQLEQANFLRPIATDSPVAADRHNRAIELFARCAKVRPNAALDILKSFIDDMAQTPAREKRS